MHQADSSYKRQEIEDDWIDRPMGAQRVVDRHCPPDHRRGDFGEVGARIGDSKGSDRPTNRRRVRKPRDGGVFKRGPSNSIAI